MANWFTTRCFGNDRFPGQPDSFRQTAQSSRFDPIQARALRTVSRLLPLCLTRRIYSSRLNSLSPALGRSLGSGTVKVSKHHQNQPSRVVPKAKDLTCARPSLKIFIRFDQKHRLPYEKQLAMNIGTLRAPTSMPTPNGLSALSAVNAWITSSSSGNANSRIWSVNTSATTTIGVPIRAWATTFLPADRPVLKVRSDPDPCSSGRIATTTARPDPAYLLITAELIVLCPWAEPTLGNRQSLETGSKTNLRAWFATQKSGLSSALRAKSSSASAQNPRLPAGKQRAMIWGTLRATNYASSSNTISLWNY